MMLAQISLMGLLFLPFFTDVLDCFSHIFNMSHRLSFLLTESKITGLVLMHLLLIRTQY